MKLRELQMPPCGDRALDGVFEIRNNHPYPEERLPKWCVTEWKSCHSRAISSVLAMLSCTMRIVKTAGSIDLLSVIDFAHEQGHRLNARSYRKCPEGS